MISRSARQNELVEKLPNQKKNMQNLINLMNTPPTWSPPSFYLDSLKQSLKVCSVFIIVAHHQYTRDLGSIQLVQAIANYHKNVFPSINPKTNIGETNGAIYAMHCLIMAFVNPGQQVIFFDPSPQHYQDQVQLARGTAKRIPLKPNLQQSRQKLKLKLQQQMTLSQQQDDWKIDFPLLQKMINKNTKMIIINSPNQIIGKIFSHQQLLKIVELLKEYPQIIIVQDHTFEHFVYNQKYIAQFPRIITMQNMFERTVINYCAGQIFGTTGVRLGWIIGGQQIIKRYRSVHQYNVSCFNDYVQNTVTKCLSIISQPENTYLKDYRNMMNQNRNILINALLNSKFDFYFLVSGAGKFIVVDISKCQIKQKYMINQQSGQRILRNIGFCIQLQKQYGILAMPCSQFYSKNNQELKQNYVMFSFCKDKQLLKKAQEVLRQSAKN